MAKNLLNANQTSSKDVLDQLYKQSDFFSNDSDNITLDALLRSANQELRTPLELYANDPATLVVNIRSITLANSETDKKRTVQPISGQLPAFTGGTITFPASSGGNATPSVGTPVVITVSSGNFIKVGVSLDSNGNIVLQPGVQAATEALASTPLVSGSNRALGHVTLQNVGGTIQNITSAAVYNYAGGGAGGSSSGSGLKNYISNPDAEVDATGWNLYADASAAEPVDGTGGSANLVFSRNTTTPQRGSADFSFAKDAVNRRGQGVSTNFTIDNADRNKTLQISFDVRADVSNYVAGDVGVFIYDVTNTTLIRPSQINIAAASYQFQATFLSTSSTSYRLIFHVASVNANAYTIFFDNVVVGPQLLTQGTPTSSPALYAPTVSGFTSATSEVYWSQDSEYMVLKGRIFGTSANGNALFFTLPTGYNIAAPTTPNQFSFGITTSSLNGDFINGASEIATAYFDGTNTNRVALSTSVNASGQILADTGSGAYGAGANRLITFDLRIRIAEFVGASAYLGTAQPEYAFNSSTTDANDTTSFAYGPQGSLIPNRSVGTGVTKRVQFLTPIQPTDKVVLQLLAPSSSTWINVDSVVPFLRQGSSLYGATVAAISGNSTDVNVSFQTNGYEASNATYAGNGGAWSSLFSAGWRWRVVKIPGQVQVAVPQFDRRQAFNSDNSTFKTSVNSFANRATVTLTRPGVIGKCLITISMSYLYSNANGAPMSTGIRTVVKDGSTVVAGGTAVFVGVPTGFSGWLTATRTFVVDYPSDTVFTIEGYEENSGGGSYSATNGTLSASCSLMRY